MNDTPVSFADFNGDGWVDVALKQNSTLWVYYHTTNVNDPYQNTSQYRKWIYNYGVNLQTLNNIDDIQVYGDMDGNGTLDFVVSEIAPNGKAPGLPLPKKIVYLKSLDDGTVDRWTVNISGYADQYSNANIFHDLNGDGLPDLLSLQPDGGQSFSMFYKLNQGNGFGGTWTDLGFMLPFELRSWDAGGPAGPEQFYYAAPIMSKVLVMDYDGDGRQEILIAGDVLASGCAEILTINGPTWECDDELYKNFDINPNSLIGAPINSSVEDNSVRTYGGKRFEEDSNGNITTVSFSTNIVAAAAQTAVIDATGDGLPDVVTVFGCRVTQCEFNAETSGRNGTVNSLYTEGAWINRNLGTAANIVGNGAFEHQGYDLMSAVEDGFGVRHEFVYRPLSSDEYDTSYSDFYVTDDDYTNTDAAYFHFASSMNVVAEHRSSNGVGGLNSTRYRYRGAIYNNWGRGFQGFKTIITEQDVYADNAPNDDTDIVTRTEFHQKWPLSSQLEYTCSWLAVS